MNNIVPMRSTAVASTEEARSVALIRRTVAADCNEAEFDLFIHTARHLRLDPLRRQIYAFVYNKDKPAKRKMSIITAIDGFRTIAERTGNYRPDEDEPTIVEDSALRGPTNPAGLLKATVRVWKFAHGEWHRVTASAYWDEYAPVKDEWKDDPDTGRGVKTGRQVLDTSGQWGKMPRVMLAKVAEALALRKAWPDDLSSVYAAEEVDRQRMLDLSPSEMVEEAGREMRQALLGGPALLVDWLDGKELGRVPMGQFADMAMAWLAASREEPGTVAAWADRNRHALREFWAYNATDALAVKKEIERIAATTPDDGAAT